jgi:hypothetical protein
VTSARGHAGLIIAAINARKAISRFIFILLIELPYDFGSPQAKSPQVHMASGIITFPELPANRVAGT